jgi:hypothetical protein
VGPRVCLDAVEKRKSCTAGKLTPAVQPVDHRYTDRAIYCTVSFLIESFLTNGQHSLTEQANNACDGAASRWQTMH